MNNSGVIMLFRALDARQEIVKIDFPYTKIKVLYVCKVGDDLVFSDSVIGHLAVAKVLVLYNGVDDYVFPLFCSTRLSFVDEMFEEFCHQLHKDCNFIDMPKVMRDVLKTHNIDLSDYCVGALNVRTLHNKRSFHTPCYISSKAIDNGFCKRYNVHSLRRLP